MKLCKHAKTGVLFCVLVLSACGSYRYVKRNPTGGVIALEGFDRNKAMEKARQAMEMHCRGQYTIVEEGEVVIGQDAYHSAYTSVSEDRTKRGGSYSTYGGASGSSTSASREKAYGSASTSGSAQTRDATEWRITYNCGNQPAPASPMPPGGY